MDRYQNTTKHKRYTYLWDIPLHKDWYLSCEMGIRQYRVCPRNSSETQILKLRLTTTYCAVVKSFSKFTRWRCTSVILPRSVKISKWQLKFMLLENFERFGFESSVDDLYLYYNRPLLYEAAQGSVRNNRWEHCYWRSKGYKEFTKILSLLI